MKTQTEVMHTPLPWSVESHTDGMSGYVFDANHEMIFGDLDLPIAKFIVKAVNSHEALLSALKNTLDALYNETASQVDTPWIQTIKETAKQAIAQAEGGK